MHIQGLSFRTHFFPPVALCLVLLILSFSTLIAQKRRDSSPSTSAVQDPNLLAAESYFKARNFAKAIEALELVVASHPRSSEEVYLMLSEAYWQTGEQLKALDICVHALELYPASRRVEGIFLSLLGAAPNEVRQKQLQKPLPKNISPTLRKTLGQFLLKEHPADAQLEQLLAGAARALPTDAEAHYLYGQWACLNNRQELCLVELKKALALASSNTLAQMQIYTMIAVAEDERNHAPQAESAFLKAQQFNRLLPAPDPLATFQYAKFLLNHAREEEAQRLLLELLRRTPAYGPARFERAKYLAKKGQSEEALSEGEQALKATGNDAAQQRAIHAFLAKTYFAVGRSAQAEEHQRALENQP